MNGQNKSILGRHTLSVFVALSLAGISGFIAYGALEANVESNKASVAEVKKIQRDEFKELNEKMSGLAKDQAVTSTRVESIQKILERIENKLDDR